MHSRRFFHLVFAGLLVCFAGLASAAPEELTAAKKADISKLLDITGGKRMAEQMTSLAIQSMRQTIVYCTNCTQQTVDVIEKEMTAVFQEHVSTPGGFIERLIAVYNKHFSHAEIRGLITFYETPLGKRLIAETPGISQDGLLAGQQWAQSLGAEQETRIKAALAKANLPLPVQMAPAPTK